MSVTLPANGAARAVDIVKLSDPISPAMMRQLVALDAALVDELELEDAVNFSGPRKDVPELLASLDALLLPSWDEPFGTIVWEAMAMRVPVVVSSVGGPGDEITDGHDGLVVPPRKPSAWRKAMARIVERPEEARRMGAEGRSTAERYSHPETTLRALGDAHLAALAANTSS